MKIGHVNQPLFFELQLDDGAIDKYPSMQVYGEDNVLKETVSMTLGTPDGTYVGSHIPSTTGYMYYIFKVFSDSARTTIDPYYGVVSDNSLITSSPIATTANLDYLQSQLIAQIATWEAKGTISLNPATDTLEMVAWLSRNGEVVLDSDSAIVEIRDGDDNIIVPVQVDNTMSPSGLFKFTKTGASAIILKNKTYVMKVTVTRGMSSYLSSVSISTY